MTPRPDIALCPVSAKSCTHHAHCLRAQLPPHPTRQAWFTPNGRGDECRYFIPTIAYPIIEFADADSSAAPKNQGQLYQPTRSRVADSCEASGGLGAAVNFEVGRATVSANTTSTGHAAGLGSRAYAIAAQRSA